MKRISETKLNIASSLILQVVTGICGLILPRFVLAAFGSEVNGLVASVSQLLGYTVLLEGGIGGVLKVALYKALASRDMDEISAVYHQISRIFRRLSYIFIAFAFVLAFVMKFLVDTQFGWLYVFLMVLILGTNTYFSYYFALPQQLLISADQKLYIIQFSQMISVIANLLACLLVIRLGGGIHMVKLTTATVYLLRPVVLHIYVKKHYQIRKVSADVPIPQRRDGAIHHITYFIHNNTDIVILSLFSSLANISVYTVYTTVINVLQGLLASISSGLSGTVGTHIARGEIKQLNRLVDRYETWNNALSTAVATVCFILILPFVSIYTNGVTDVDYHQPVFALLLILGSYAYSIRHPFGCVVSASGHYRETRAGAIGEVTLNLGLSLLLVKPLGLSGVALGTFAAMAYRTIYLVWYLSKNLLHRPMGIFLLKLACNVLLGIGMICWIPMWISTTASSILGLLICAIKISLIVFPAFVGMNWLLLKVNSVLRKGEQ